MPKKRRSGEGYDIVKLKSGKYSKRITVGTDPITGKQKRETVHGSTPAEVRSNAQRLLREHETGEYKEQSKLTVAEWLTQWLEIYAKPNVKLSTYASYEGYVNKHVIPALGKVKLSKLRVDTVQMFYNDKQKNGRMDKAKNKETGELEIKQGGLSPKTITNMHNMLHKSFKQAYKNGIINNNVFDAVETPKISKKEMRFLSLEEQERLTAATKKHPLGMVVRLALATGMRKGELLALTWNDIDLEKNHLYVRHTLSRLKNYDGDTKTRIIIGEPKTAKAKREIPLGNRIVEQLVQHKKTQVENKAKAGKLYQDNNFVFCNIIGSLIEPRTFHDYFKQICGWADIKDCNVHSLRHTFATRALENNIPVKTVSEILGHASIAITLDLYTHVTLDNKRDAIDALDHYFI